MLVVYLDKAHVDVQSLYRIYPSIISIVHISISIALVKHSKWSSVYYCMQLLEPIKPNPSKYEKQSCQGQVTLTQTAS